MNFIEHPSYSEQIHEIEFILSKLTLENLNRLLNKYEYQCISFEQLQTSGRVNLLFNLKCQTKTCSNIEFILKISNPHRYWKEYRTRNEIYAMLYLCEHTTIPIPNIIDYSHDVHTSILACEYILMEKIYGSTLESMIDHLSDQILIQTAMEMTEYVKQMRQINFLEMNQIGSFSHREMLLGGMIDDGPSLGPFNNIKEYIIKHLQWSIRRIQTDEQLYSFRNHLIVLLEKIIEHAQSDSNLINTEIPFHFTHTDLNSSNILIDQCTGHIKAILDWEKCGITFSNNDIEFYSRWFNGDHQREEHFQSILCQQSTYLELFKEKSDLHHVEPYLEIMYSAMYATFYSCTWFDGEQTVIKHIKQFFEETEKAIIDFNKSSSIS